MWRYLPRGGWLLVAPLMVLVLGLFLGPLTNIMVISVTDPKPGLGNYAALFQSDALGGILWTTLRVCVLTTAISVTLGYCIAYAMIHALARERNWMLSLLLVSFWISVLVRTFSWLMLLGRNGLVNNGLEAIGLITQPIEFMRNELGVLIGMVHYMVPYAVLPLLASMQTIDARVLAASRNLGASPAQTFWRVYLPLTRPGLVAAALLVFILSLGFYVTPAILGGGKVLMVAEYISVQILVTLRWGDRGYAGRPNAGGRVGPVVRDVTFHEAFNRLWGGKTMMQKSGLGQKINRVWAIFLLVFLVAPALVALPVSLTPKRFLSMPTDTLSLRHFEKLFTSPEWISSFAQSATIALTSAALATVLGTLCAIGLWRISSRAGEVVRAFLLLPLVIPPIISAMAFYRLFVPLGLIDSYLGLMLAHTVLAAPLVLITVSASLAGFDPRLEQASRNLGASSMTTLLRVILPSIRPGVLAGAVFAFIASWDEIVVTLFLSKFNVYTLPRRMWNGIRENTDPTVAAAAVVLIGITIIAFLIWALVQRRARTQNS